MTLILSSAAGKSKSNQRDLLAAGRPNKEFKAHNPWF